MTITLGGSLMLAESVSNARNRRVGCAQDECPTTGTSHKIPRKIRNRITPSRVVRVRQ
jgi:hypothetical protein